MSSIWPSGLSRLFKGRKKSAENESWKDFVKLDVNWSEQQQNTRRTSSSEGAVLERKVTVEELACESTSVVRNKSRVTETDVYPDTSKSSTSAEQSLSPSKEVSLPEMHQGLGQKSAEGKKEVSQELLKQIESQIVIGDPA